jgi:hypothetical protein
VAHQAAHRQLLRLEQARRRLLHLRHASGCLGTSRSSSRDLSRGSSSTTSPLSRVRVSRHVARIIVDYFGSRRLIFDYFAYAARPSASARRAAHHRLLRLRRTFGFFGTLRGTSRGSSHGSSSTTPCAATSSCCHIGSTPATPSVAATCLAATLALLRVRVDHSSRLIFQTSQERQSRPQQLIEIDSD